MPDDVPIDQPPPISTITWFHIFVFASYVVYDSMWNGVLPILASNVSCIHEPFISTFDVILPVMSAIFMSMPMPWPLQVQLPAIALPISAISFGGVMSGIWPVAAVPPAFAS